MFRSLMIEISENLLTSDIGVVPNWELSNASPFFRQIVPSAEEKLVAVFFFDIAPEFIGSI